MRGKSEIKIHYYFCVTSNRLEAGYDMYTTEASVWYTVAENRDQMALERSWWISASREKGQHGKGKGTALTETATPVISLSHY